MSNKTTMKPNRLNQATQELNGIIKASEVPSTINSGEASGYVYIVVKSKDNLDGTAKMHDTKMIYAPIDKHKAMVLEIPRYRGLWNGMFNKVVILHDPTLPNVVEEPEEKDVKDLSPSQKSKVNAAMAEGKGQDDEGLKAIGKEFNISFDRLKAYIKSGVN